MNVSTGLRVDAAVEIEYGPLRVCAAKWMGKLPSDVTADDVARYQIVTGSNEEGAQA